MNFNINVNSEDYLIFLNALSQVIGDISEGDCLAIFGIPLHDLELFYDRMATSFEQAEKEFNTSL
jgi:hypothetical protein